MKINEVKKILKTTRLSSTAKAKTEEIVEQMESIGVTDFLRGQLVRVIRDEAETNKLEKQYLEDVKITLENFLSDAEKRLEMANEEIEESAK